MTVLEQSSERSALRKEHILDVARQHFADHGYDGTSMRNIAAAVGINIATLYFHCTTKEQLFFDVLDARRKFLWEGLQSTLANAGSSWTERTSAAITFHIVANCEAPGPLVSAMSLRRLPGPLSQRYVAQRDEYERQFRELVAGGVAAGEFAPTDVPLAVAGMLGIGFSVAQWYHPGGRLDPRAIAAHYVHLVLRGLATRTEE
jgi:AcrR family transcriptional regulator